MFKKKYPYLIAEVGSNHLGNFDIAKKSILLAKESGANCVKFQLFDENNLVTKKMLVYKHVKDKTYKYQYQRFNKVKLNINQIKELFKISKKIGIDFSVTPFSESYIKKISPFVTFFKVASGDIDNYPLLREISKTKKNVILSTGMADLKEIKKAISFFDKKRLAVLHCISCYPTLDEDSNLLNIKFLKEKFNVKVGYSDHTKGINVASKSIFFGAEIIEKHFLPKKTKLAGDYSLSLGPKEFRKLANEINKNFKIMGKIRNGVYECEKYFQKNLRRSLYYSNNFKKGHILKRDNISFLRPFDKKGLKINKLSSLIGKKLLKNVKIHQLILNNKKIVK